MKGKLNSSTTKIFYICTLSMQSLLIGHVHANDFSGTYAKLLSMHAFDDISASGLHSNGNKYLKLAIPWRSDCATTINNYCAGFYMKGSYLELKSEKIDLEGFGRTQFSWKAYGATIGGDITFPFSQYFSVRAGTGFGYTEAYNKNRNAQLLLKWKQKKVIFVSPEIEAAMKKNNFTIKSKISFVSLKEIYTGGKDINSWAGSYSINGEYTFINSLRFLGKDFNVIIGNKWGGFYGNGWRDDLGFGFINESQVLLGIPFVWGGQNISLKLGPGFLLGDRASRGISFSVSIK